MQPPPPRATAFATSDVWRDQRENIFDARVGKARVQLRSTLLLLLQQRPESVPIAAFQNFLSAISGCAQSEQRLHDFGLARPETIPHIGMQIRGQARLSGVTQSQQ